MSAPLPFDPVERAGQSWQEHYPDAGDDVYSAMRAVTSIMRAQQILIAGLDAVLKPFGLTFSRYEALVLLTFSSTGALPLSKIGERLQVHATSVTNVVDRLESSGFVRREPNPRDGRGTLAVITEAGRAVADAATRELHQNRFGLQGLDTADLQGLFVTLRRLRAEAGDFEVPVAAHFRG
jgi:DNA-binding MarR family transcriptional regulator